MRFLADVGISSKTVGFLLEKGHEAIHARTIGMQTAEDRALTERAVVDGAVILTFDLDFGDILALGVLDRPSVVIDHWRLAAPRLVPLGASGSESSFVAPKRRQPGLRSL